MSHTAVMKLISNFSKINLIIYQQFFYSFNFIDDNELLYGDTFYF